MSVCVCERERESERVCVQTVWMVAFDARKAAAHSPDIPSSIVSLCKLGVSSTHT